MTDYFYNKEIVLLKETEGHMYHGSWVDGEIMEVKTITCDVQPASREQIFKDYGYYIDCTKRVFCNLDSDITIGGMVRYRENNFDVVKVIEWDDYLDVFIKERGDSNGE